MPSNPGKKVKSVRFADEEEHFEVLDTNFDRHIVVPSPSATTVTFSDYDYEHIMTPSTPTLSSISLPSPDTLSPISFTSAEFSPPIHPVVLVPHPFGLVHPAIAYPQPLIFLTFTLPPTLQHFDRNLLYQHATPTIPKSMEILTQGFPWRIVVYPAHGAAYVTIGDIMERIYLSMHKEVTEEEFQLSRQRVGDKAVEEVIRRWRKRDPQGLQRIKRIDYLMGKTTFRGLEPLNPDSGQWRMHCNG